MNIAGLGIPHDEVRDTYAIQTHHHHHPDTDGARVRKTEEEIAKPPSKNGSPSKSPPVTKVRSPLRANGRTHKVQYIHTPTIKTGKASVPNPNCFR